jgi:DNA-binding NtrC family response regulator
MAATGSTEFGILVVDDDPTLARSVVRILGQTKLPCTTAPDAETGLELLSRGPFGVAVVDVMLPGMNGIQFLERAKALRPDLEIVMMTGSGSVQTAVEAMRIGAYDYLQKPFESLEKLVAVVSHAAERHALRRRNTELERLFAKREEMAEIIGNSDAMQPVFELLATVADTPATVLVSGESGTGKELVARALHRLSPRAKEAFVAVNCSAFPETLLDTELFGHAKGAFTGASEKRAGVFETAHKGTLFLDEIGDIAQGTQVRLLRALQEGEVKRVGDSTPFHVDVRVVAATNVDLRKAVKEGKFREDLYYRLNVVSIHLPPLRDRVADIPALVDHFIGKHSQRMGRCVERVSDVVLAALCQHGWPGNIRELENTISRAIVMTRGEVIEDAALPAELRAVTVPNGTDPLVDRLPYTEAKRLVVEGFQRRYLHSKLREAGGNITKAAELSGLDRSNFRRLCRVSQVEVADEAETEAG